MPRGGAKEAFECTDPEAVVAGPAGTGKSRSVLESIHRDASTYEDAKFLLVRKTLTSLTATGLRTWEEHVINQDMANGEVTYFGGSGRIPAHYHYKRTGARVMAGGLDNRKAVEKVMSSEYDRVFVQEATDVTEEDWEKLSTRLRNGKMPYAQLIGDANPATPTHWLKIRCDRGTTRMIESRHSDNPVYFNDDGEMTPAGEIYLQRLNALTGVRYKRLRLGLWVAAEGIIYEGWDPAVHLVDPFDPPPDWARYWAVDFGFTNPLCCQWWAVDPDGRAWLYREHVKTRMLVEDHAKIMLRLSEGEPRPVAIICDHDAEDRATLERHLGLSTVPAKKTVSEGIQHVASRLKPAGDGKPRLMVMRDAVVERDPLMDEAKKPIGFAEEISGYIWAPSLDGKPQKEEPLKVDDHSADAARYLIAELDLGGRPRIRWL